MCPVSALNGVSLQVKMCFVVSPRKTILLGCAILASVSEHRLVSCVALPGRMCARMASIHPMERLRFGSGFWMERHRSEARIICPTLPRRGRLIWPCSRCARHIVDLPRRPDLPVPSRSHVCASMYHGARTGRSYHRPPRRDAHLGGLDSARTLVPRFGKVVWPLGGGSMGLIKRSLHP